MSRLVSYSSILLYLETLTANATDYVLINTGGNNKKITLANFISSLGLGGGGGGITSLNTLTGATQTFATGTSGTDFGISSAGTAHTFNIPDSSASNRGLLTSTDWSNFNSKEPALTKGNLTETLSSVLTISGGSNAVIGSGTTIQVKQATSSQDGFLKASDWTTFNSKGNGTITSVTGTSPISSSGGTTPAISISDAVADGSTKGAAAFNANDFNSSSGVISIDYSNGQVAGSSTTGFLKSSDWTTFNNKQETANDIYDVFNLLGSSFKGMSVGSPNNLVIQGTQITSQTLYLLGYYLPKAATITGVKWYQGTQGVYTASNYNGVGLYTYSGGTLTLVASSTNDGNIWKATGSAWSSKAFTSTYSASKGLYFIGVLHSASATTTAPTIGSGTAYLAAVVPFDFTNSAKLQSLIAGQTSLPSSQAMSATSNLNATFVVHLY
jgi:hypothetical protein